MNKYTVNQTPFLAVCTSICTGTLTLTRYVPPPHTRHKFQAVPYFTDTGLVKKGGKRNHLQCTGRQHLAQQVSHYDESSASDIYST